MKSKLTGIGMSIRGRPKKRKLIGYLIPIIVVAILLILLIPTPHSRTKQESYTEFETVTKTDLIKTLPCSGTLKDGDRWEWGLTDLPTTLKVIVKLSSTEEVNVVIESVSGVDLSKSGKSHDYSFYSKGPSLKATVTNPTLLGLGPSAVISGNIEIYHEYQAQVPVTKYRTVPYTEWLPWWMS